MSTRIKRFIGVSIDEKQVTIIKTEEEHQNAPGKFNVPVFTLSTGEHLNPLNKECTKFQILDSEIKVGIIQEK